MRILHQSVRFVNTKISEGIPKLAPQPTQLKPIILPPTLHLWTIILLVIVSGNFADAQRNSASVSDTLSSKADERFARALEPMTFRVSTRSRRTSRVSNRVVVLYRQPAHRRWKRFRLSINLFPLCTDTPNARADVAFRHKPSLHGAFCCYRCSEQRIFLF